LIDLFTEAGGVPTGRKAGPRISAAFAFALAGHIVLLSALLIAHPPGPSAASPERETIRRALAELAKEKGPSDKTSEKDLEEAAQTVGRSIGFRDEEDLRKKVEIVKAMIRSFFRAGGEKEGSYLDLSQLTLDEIQAKIEDGTIRLPEGDKAFAAKSLENRHELEIHTLNRDDETEISRLAVDKGAGSAPTASRKSPPEVYYIDPEIYYRQSPYEQILAYGPSLFTVAQEFPDFAPPVEKMKASKPRSQAEAAARMEDSSLLTVWLVSGDSEFVTASSADAGDPFDPARAAETLDAWMARSEREQFADFQGEYLDKEDPDSVDLARFTGEFISANLNGVFYTANRFAEAFDSLEELYYKRPIYDAFLGYARRHPGTRTAAEFLFSLAAAYDFERRTLRLLTEVESEAAEVLSEGVLKSGIYDYRVKAYVLKKTAEKIRAALLKNGGLQINDALASYRKASLAIYRHLAAMGDETRDRALFAVGATFWEDGEPARAFETWRRIDPTFEESAYRFIKPSLYSSGKELGRAADDIAKFLASQARVGNQALLRRHLRFHKWTTRAKDWSGTDGRR